jgi:oxalate decarboxylase/phosphoglucose isomerase-like protein (cupin superfamily)
VSPSAAIFPSVSSRWNERKRPNGIVPAGSNHNIINTGTLPLKLYTLYAPPNHRDGVVHHTRADAEADSEKFDDKTSE